MGNIRGSVKLLSLIKTKYWYKYLMQDGVTVKVLLQLLLRTARYN